MQWPGVLPEPVNESVLGQLAEYTAVGGLGPRIIGAGHLMQARQQERGIEPVIGGGPLPASAGVHAIAEVGQYLVGQ